MRHDTDPINIVVCGIGGQGNVLLSRFLARILFRRGFGITIGETFGASQRGGAVMSHVRLSRKSQYGALIPHGRASLVIGLEPMETVRVLGEYGNPEVSTILNVRPAPPLDVIVGNRLYPELERVKVAARELSARSWHIDATGISLELGSPILTNMVMIGALLQSGELDLTQDEVESAIHETFPASAVEMNVRATVRGSAEVRVL